MKKIKYLLMLSLIAVLAVGVFVGCSSKAGVDSSKYPYKVTYCTNGGTIEDKAERYLYLQGNGVRAPEPKEESVLKPVVRVGFKFLGWAKCKVDEEGKPVLRDTPVLDADGGVWMTKDGAVTEDMKDDSAQLKYYDYNPSDLWDYSTDIVDENLALVAVWEELSKFIFANKTESGEWEDLTPLVNGTVSIENELYASRLCDVTYDKGTKIRLGDITTGYSAKRPGFTYIRFYLDKECTEEITGIITIKDSITVIYCTEIEGDYAVVRDFRGFNDAVKANKNIYLDANEVEVGEGEDAHMEKIIDANGVRLDMNGSKYTGIIYGNNHIIKNVASEVKQRVFNSTDADAINAYGGFFGDLAGAKIYDLTVDMSVKFEINVDPASPNTSQGSARDSLCYLGVFAKSMTECTLENVNITVEYEITRSLVKIDDYIIDPETGNPTQLEAPNDYNVEVRVGQWQAVEAEGNTMTDSSITVNQKATEAPDEEIPDAE